MKTMKCAIFDLDGTLLDSMWVWENIDVEFLSRYDVIPADEVRKKVKTLSLRQSTELFKDLYDLPDSIENIMSNMSQMGKEKYESEVLLKPFVLQYLNELKENNIPICLATASSKSNVILALTRVGILDLFDLIITSSDIKTGKDNPEIFLTCANQFGVKPQDAVVFEDALHAIQTAKSAGFTVVGVFDKSAHEDTKEIKNISDYYINDFSEMEKLY